MIFFVFLLIPLLLYYLLFCLIFRNIQKLLPLRKIKIENKTLHTPVYSLEYEVSKHKVVLYGMIHVGDKTYYESIFKDLVSFEDQDYLVLYEKVSKPEDVDVEEFSENQKDIYDMLVNLLGKTKLIAKSCGLSLQKECIPLKENWINTDLTLTELVNRLDEKSLNPKDLPFKNVTSKDFKEDPKFFSSLFRWSLRNFDFIFSLFWVVRVFKQKREKLSYKIFKEVILGERSDIGVKSILDNSHKNVVCTWGSAHLADMVPALVKEGYSVQNVSWIEVLK